MDLIKDRINLSGGMIFNDSGEVLLLLKRKHHHWELPGGKVERNESIKEAALREIKEEVGLNVFLKGFLGVFYFSMKGKQYASHTFLFKMKGKARLNEPQEFNGLAFADPFNPLLNNLAPNVKKIFKEINKGKELQELVLKISKKNIKKN